MRLAPAFIQPMAADDVAQAVATVALGAPVHGIVKVAGPDQFRLDDLVRQDLSARHDPREVVADPHARYYGAELHVRTLIPGDGALLGETYYADWLSHAAIQK